MNDDEKREKLTGRLSGTAETGEVYESMNRFLEGLSGSLLKVSESLHDVLSALYTRDAASLSSEELATLIDFKDTEDPDALVPIVADEIKKYKSEYKLETLTVKDMLDENIGAVQQACMYDPDADPEDPETPICIYDIIMYRAKERLEKDNLEKQIKKTKVPTSYSFLNSKLSYKLDEMLNNGKKKVIISGKNAAKKIVTPSEFVMVDTEGVTIDGHYTPFDREVQNAIVTLYKNGSPSHLITDRLVAKTIAQSTKARISPQLKDAVAKSIMKQRIIHGDCDVSAATTGKKTPLKAIGGFLLELRDVTLKSGDRAYYIMHEPLLLEYSRRIGRSGEQVKTIPASLRDIKKVKNGKATEESIENTIERITIKSYLIRRIETMKYDLKLSQNALNRDEKKRKEKKDKGDSETPPKTLASYRRESNRILYDTLFKETELTNCTRSALSKYKGYIEDCMTYWVSVGYISSYKVVAGQRKDSKIAVDIILK